MVRRPWKAVASPDRCPTGGWSFAADPDVTALEQPVFWRPELNAATVVLAAAGPDVGGAVPFTPEQWPGDVTARPSTTGLHVCVRAGTQEHQLWAPPEVTSGAPVVAAVPFDELAPLRADAALRFRRHLAGERQPARQRAPDQTLRRARLSVRALDAHLSGASYRGLAEGLYGPARIDPSTWRSDSLRDTTIRLVRNGLAFSRGGYRRLLGRRSGV